MLRLLSGGMKSNPIDGNIIDIKRDENNKLLFRVEMCNIIKIESGKVEFQKSALNFTAQGNKAEVIEREFKNGDLVRAWHIVSMSDLNGTVKFKAKNIEKLCILLKEVD